ncbi:MAG: TauD/TfdA family dioxygenase [Pseudomonadota bacterium]
MNSSSAPAFVDCAGIETALPATATVFNYDDLQFPLIIEKQGSGAASHDALQQWIDTNSEQIEWHHDQVGAVLFRNFDLFSSDDFDRFIRAFDLPNFTYKESLSNAVRVNRTERVFTANEAPPDVNIVMHHEMAQTPIYPSRLLFFCEKAAEIDGATPLCRSDVLLQRLEEQEPELVRNCEAHGLKYSSEMPADSDESSGQGRSWSSTLGVSNMKEAERKLADLGYDWAWIDGDCLRVTTPVLPAIRELDSGRRTFFNQLISAAYGWKPVNGKPAVCYGNGAAIPDGSLKAIADCVEALSFDLDWQQGDVALINNFLVMHGRRSFQGTRRVLASLVA